MVTIQIQTQDHSYPVYLGEGLRYRVSKLLSKNYHNILVISDDTVAQFDYVKDVVSSLTSNETNIYTYIIPSGEASKSLEQFGNIQTFAIENQLDRHALILAVGGGVVGDIAGFVAATFMRGIDYVQVPTTILAHDSSVGGKVAINHPLGKNLIGSFHQPVAVIYDLETLHSLSLNEKRSGFAEVIKHACIADENLLHKLMNEVRSFNDLSNDILYDSIGKGISIKAKIVEQDEKEHGVRSFLNFGHTLGHALETEAGYGELTHGEGVAIGMVFAAKLSHREFGANPLPEGFVDWLYQLGYRFDIVGKLDVPTLIEQMKKDKKNSHGTIRMVLVEKIGQPSLVPIDEHVLKIELEQFQKEVVRYVKGI